MKVSVQSTKERKSGWRELQLSSFNVLTAYEHKRQVSRGALGLTASGFTNTREHPTEPLPVAPTRHCPPLPSLKGACGSHVTVLFQFISNIHKWKLRYLFF